MDAVDEDEEAMLAMMGMGSFGTTKVRQSPLHGFIRVAHLSPGQEGRRKPGRYGQYQESTDVAAVHESVRFSTLLRRSRSIF